MFNDLRLNYTRGRFSNTRGPAVGSPLRGANLNTAVGPAQHHQGRLAVVQRACSRDRSLGGGGSTATGFGGAGSTNVDDREERYAITDIVYKNVRQHEPEVRRGHVALAAERDSAVRRVRRHLRVFAPSQTNSTGTSAGTGGSPWASFLLGVANGNVTLRNVQIPYYYRWNSGAGVHPERLESEAQPHLEPRASATACRCRAPRSTTTRACSGRTWRKSCTLATPLKLPDGRPSPRRWYVPFAFSGLGGNSRYLTPPQYTRFRAALRLRLAAAASCESHHVVLRGGYGLSHAPISGFTQLPQPGFRRHPGLRHHGALGHGESELRDAAGRESAGDYAGRRRRSRSSASQGPPANGLVLRQQPVLPAASAASRSRRTITRPTCNNWNFTLSWQANNTTTVEVAYIGSHGHPPVHADGGPEPEELQRPERANCANNINTTGTINDPLGRKNPITGAKSSRVQNGTGQPLSGLLEPQPVVSTPRPTASATPATSTSSTASRAGLTFIANYTYAKSIDTASSAGGDKNILTPVGGQVGGQVAFGGTRGNDRSVSTYDQRHVIHGTFIYDLPFGNGRRFGRTLEAAGLPGRRLDRHRAHAPEHRLPVHAVYSADTNQLGDLTHTARPDLMPGVPLINPLWPQLPDRARAASRISIRRHSCVRRWALGQRAAHSGRRARPVAAVLRRLHPEELPLGEGGKRRLQFRVDALNVFNHPVFAVYPNNAGGADFMGAPSTAASRLRPTIRGPANGQPLQSTTAGAALLHQINTMVNAQKNAAGVLPANFFSIPLPAQFLRKQPANFDITTLHGYKLYQLRTGLQHQLRHDLYNNNTPRYVQFGVKLYF